MNVVNPWWGETYADAHGKDFWDTVRLATDETEGWYTDVIRVPAPPDMIAEAGLETMVEEYLDRVVELTRERGVYVLLDYHAVARYDTTEMDTRLREFWNLVAPRYAEESHVLYELFNEPTRPAGEGLDSWLTWRETAQPWVDLVRDHAPETPIAQYRVTVGDRDPLVFRSTRNSVEITDLSPGETYDVRVVAVDANGRASDPTTLTVSTPSAGDPVLSIPRAPATPTIDATVEELWSQVPSRTIDRWLWGEAATDPQATWRACWDAQALYVLVSVADDDVVTDGELPYRNDSVELYLDLDNSRAADYDGRNDLHAVYVRGHQWVAAGTDLPAGTDPIDVATTETDDGWRLETAIAWDPHGVTPSRGHRLGFDVHVADNEGGEKRDGKRTWFAETDTSWKDPRTFAVVELGGPP